MKEQEADLKTENSRKALKIVSPTKEILQGVEEAIRLSGGFEHSVRGDSHHFSPISLQGPPGLFLSPPLKPLTVLISLGTPLRRPM